VIYRHWELVPASVWSWSSFSPAEIACRHCGELLLDLDFMDGLQDLRDLLGRPVHLTCAYRCAVHNARVGGAPGSMHLKGRAADIALLRLPRAALAHAGLSAGFTGFGYYNTFLHVDTGRRRWWGNKEIWK
jgi:uncharacterized protein YcbK (DUF882 family)